MTDIQHARDVLAKWREDAFDGRWVRNWHSGEIAERERVLQFGAFADADARLIVGTAGNPELLDAIDGLLWAAGSPVAAQGLVKTAERIAAAIIAADERMSA